MPMTTERQVETLSVVVPAWNESAGIDWAVAQVRDGIEALCRGGRIASGEIVIANDHSTDATAERVLAMADQPGPVVRLVSVVDGKGLGAAIRTGLAAATGDLVVYTDADLPFDPHDLARLIRAADRYRADVVCGYRFDRTLEGGRRAVQSHAYNVLVRGLLPVRVRDVNFACKLLRRPVVDAVVPELVSDGSFIDAELVARCGRGGWNIVQVGVDYFPRRGSPSTLGGLTATVTSLRELSALARELRRQP